MIRSVWFSTISIFQRPIILGDESRGNEISTSNINWAEKSGISCTTTPFQKKKKREVRWNFFRRLKSNFYRWDLERIILCCFWFPSNSTRSELWWDSVQRTFEFDRWKSVLYCQLRDRPKPKTMKIVFSFPFDKNEPRIVSPNPIDSIATGSNERIFHNCIDRRIHIRTKSLETNFSGKFC